MCPVLRTRLPPFQGRLRLQFHSEYRHSFRRVPAFHPVRLNPGRYMLTRRHRHLHWWGGTPKICQDPGTIAINITGDSPTTEYFFGYQTSTGEDGSASFTGNGQHSIPIAFTTPADNSAVTVTYRLRYVANGAEAPAVCATADQQVALTDNSYRLSLTAVGSQERCHNSGDGSINLTVNNGAGPYTYQWPGNRTTEDLSGLSGGQRYRVSVHDKHGCTDTASVYVINPPAVQVSNAYITSDHNGFGVSCHLNDAGGIKNDGMLQVEAFGGTGALSYRLQGNTYNKPSRPLPPSRVYIRIRIRFTYRIQKDVRFRPPSPFK